jgi:hypothetical protein
MKNFFDMADALKNGKSVRYSDWDNTTRMFVKADDRICKGEAEPLLRLVTTSHDGALCEANLSWFEMTAEKWQVVEATTAH